MLTKDFINKKLKLSNAKTLVSEALKQSKKFCMPQIPVCVNGMCGFLFISDLKSLPADSTLATAEHLIVKVQLNTKDHIWESLRRFKNYETNALPIVNTKGNGIGIVLLKDVFNRMFEVFPIGNDGAILELEMNYNNYSLTTLSNIVENANAKVTALSVFPIQKTDLISIVFNINKNDASEVIQSLERHNYHVNAWYMNKGKIDKILEERYDALMNFINV